MLNEKIKHILAAAAGIISLLIYMLTLSPTVTFMDSGELAASVYTFGIPHPTGYPLYLVLGYIIAHLPLGPSVIFRLNFFSAVTSAIAVVVFYYAAIVFLGTFNVNKKIKKENEKKKKEPELSAPVIYVISFFAALCFSLSRNFWGNAVVNEVYSLHSIFICLFILFSLKIYRNLSESPLKYWTLLFIFAGLSFSNHLTTVFLIPSLLYILFLQNRVSPLRIKKVLLRSVLIIPGLLIYIVLMIASASGPFFNWSNPVNLPNLFHHMSGGDFSHLFMASTGVFSKNLKHFAENFFNVYGIICTIILLIGYIFLYKRNKELFIFFTLLIAASIGFGLNYNVLDVENYFSLMFTAFGFCLALGIFELFLLARKKLKVYTASLQYLAVSGVILSGTVFITNYNINNHSKDYSAEDLTVNTLNNLKPNSVLVSYEWTNIYHSSLYFQKVEQSRPDVKIILIRLLAAPWYLNTLQKYYPDLYSNFSKEAAEYIANYDKDLNIQAPKLINMVRAFFRNNIGKFPMYITYDMFYNKDIPNLFSDYGWKPASLCYEITPKNEPYDSTAGMITLDYNFRPYNTDDANKRKMKISTAGIYYDFAYYHYRNHNYQAALRFADKSLSIDNLADAIKLKNIIINEAKNK